MALHGQRGLNIMAENVQQYWPEEDDDDESNGTLETGLQDNVQEYWPEEETSEPLGVYEETEEQKPWYQPAANFLEGLNYAIASGINVPYQAGREAHQMMFGGDVTPSLPNYDPDDPVGGANAIYDLFEWAKTGVSREKPEGYAAKVGEVAALNLATAVPALRAGQASQFTYGWVEPLIQYVRSAPLAATLMDFGLSLPMGLGAERGRREGKKYGQEDTGEALGMITGSLAALPLYPLSLAATGTANWARNLKGIGLTEGSRKKIVSDTLQASTTPEQQAALEARDFEVPTLGGPFTTGEVLDAGGLSRLRASIIEQSDPSIEREKALMMGREGELVSALETLRGDPLQSEAARFFANRIEATLTRINAHLATARSKAQVRIDKLGPNQSVEAAATITRDEINKAYTAARKAENVIWKNIGDGRFNTNAIVQKAKDIIADTPRLSGEGGKADIPLAILEIAGRDAVIGPRGAVVKTGQKSTLKEVETADEIAALSSRFNEDIRVATAAGQLNRARQLRKIRDAVYDLIVPVSGDATGLEQARAFSRVLNDKFTRGSVGRLFGLKASGELKIDPEMTLHKLVIPGPQGKIAVQQLRAAAGETEGGAEAIDTQIRQHLLNLFAAKTTSKTGEFDAGAAHTFVKNNQSLDLFPDLKAQMVDAKQAQLLINRVSAAAKSRTDGIKTQAVASRVLKGEVPILVSSIFKQKNPIQNAQELLRVASKDPTGQATAGVQRAFYDYMFDKMVTTVGESGRQVLDIKVASDFVGNQTNRAVIKVMYGDDALKLLDAVIKGGKYQLRGRPEGTLRSQKRTGTMIREMAGNIGTMMGTRLFGKLTGHAMLAAGVGKKYAHRIFDAIAFAPQDEINVLLLKALEDPELARLLMTHSSKFTTEKAMRLSNYATIKELMNLALQNDINLTEKVLIQ